MTRRFQVFVAALMLLAVASAVRPAPAPALGGYAQIDPTMQFDMRLKKRALWSGHIFWVRNFVLSTNYGDAAAAGVADKMVAANAGELAGSLEPYYGTEAAEEFLGLLTDHYNAIKDYMYAVFGSDGEAREKASASLESNAGAMADFLSGANPYLERDAVLALLTEHVGHHMAQIDMIDEEDFTTEADVWAEMARNANAIADAAGSAIIKHFPAEFRR